MLLVSLAADDIQRGSDRFRPDVCLLDLDLWGLPAPLDWIHSVFPDSQAQAFVFLSGDQAPVSLDSLTAAVPSAVALKPVDEARLWNAIAMAMHRRAALLVPRSMLDEAQRERRVAEDQLRRVLRLETVGRLAGGIAHDFNNLLMVVQGHTDRLLVAFSDTDEVQRRLIAIRTATRRAAGLTQQLLAFGRRQVLQPEVVDVTVYIEEACQMLRGVIGATIEIVVTIEAGGAAVLVDPGQFEQILLNLGLNARDAMPDGGVLTFEASTLEVRERMLLPSSDVAWVAPGRYVQLIVRDRGMGMAADTVARAFEPFFTTKPSGKGLGMGLASVYGAVKQSDGFVWIQSDLGVGTAVHVLLPGADRPAVSARGASGSIDLPVTRTILLVEDEADVRSLLIDALEQAGYRVVEADNGEIALDRLREPDLRVDVLVTDVIMPRLGGPELVRAGRALRPGLPVIFISGYAPDARALNLGGDAITAFLQKPFSSLALCEQVASMLGLPPS